MSPLVILVLFSVAAIGAVALLLHRLGYSKTGTFDDDAAAERAFSAEYPEYSVDKVSRAMDGGSAIFTLANTPMLGIVHTMGKFAVAKTIAPADISSSDFHDNTLTLHIRDFADPVFKITFKSEEEARSWAALFEPAKGAKDHA